MTARVYSFRSVSKQSSPFNRSIGNTLYRHAAGLQSLDPGAPQLDDDSTVAVASAGKFITHVAALQLVERGVIKLDDPVYEHLPELAACHLIVPAVEGGAAAATLRPPTNKITLRHLLLHSSGLSNHTEVSKHLASDAAKIAVADEAHPLVKHFSIPLVFEPGEGFYYGYSIHWTQLLVGRLTGDFVGHVQTHIFDPLGMASSKYVPQHNSDIWARRLRMVERLEDELVAADDASQGLMCSVSDLGAILVDLISSSSKLLSHKEHMDLLFMGQFRAGSAALKDLRDDRDNYAFCAGKSSSLGVPSVNWTAAGLLAEENLPVSEMPRGTVTWDSMPNLMWAMNRERGRGMLFATQLIPAGDEKANRLAQVFMKDAWGTFD